jgi:hypothetical protein
MYNLAMEDWGGKHLKWLTLTWDIENEAWLFGPPRASPSLVE